MELLLAENKAQADELADELKEAGMDLPYGILSIDELVDELVPLLK